VSFDNDNRYKWYIKIVHDSASVQDRSSVIWHSEPHRFTYTATAIRRCGNELHRRRRWNTNCDDIREYPIQTYIIIYNGQWLIPINTVVKNVGTLLRYGLITFGWKNCARDFRRGIVGKIEWKTWFGLEKNVKTTFSPNMYSWFQK